MHDFRCRSDHGAYALGVPSTAAIIGRRVGETHECDGLFLAFGLCNFALFVSLEVSFGKSWLFTLLLLLPCARWS